MTSKAAQTRRSAAGEDETGKTMRNAVSTIPAFCFLSIIVLPAGAVAQLGGKLVQPTSYAYHAGDDITWAQPEFDDTRWQRVPIDKLPTDGWQGVGWFRSTITVDSTLWDVPLGLSLSYAGAAEVYLDGVRIRRYGKVGTTREEEEANVELLPRPQELAFRAPPGEHRATSRHLLAIRYSCFFFQSSVATRGCYPQFRVDIDDLMSMTIKREEITHKVVAHQMLLTGIFLAFSLVHALLFFFYSQHRANLYFAALTASLALTVYIWFQPYFSSGSTYQVVSHLLGLVFMTFTMLCFLRLTYSLAYPVRPRWFPAVLVSGLGLLALCLFKPLVTEGLLVFFWIAVFAEVLRALITARLRRRDLQLEGSWIISLALIPLSLTGVYWLLALLGLAPEPWPFEVFPVPFYMMLLLMVSMSIFLARNFARANQTLEAQLVKVSATEREVRRTRDVFRLFVPDAVLDRIAKQGLESIKLGGAEEGIATILFTDIRSFTSIAETLSPNETLAFLNEFMRRMEPVIHKNGGFINQFVGDEIMAIFHLPAHENAAIETAIAMRRALNEHNRERAARGEPAIDIGVGVNTGKVIWGTIGSEVRMESAIIGDTVNLASRLQDLTREYGVGVLVSESAFREIPNPERFCHREIDVVQVRGKNKPVVVYEVFDADPDPIVLQKKSCLSQYNRGLWCYHAEDWRQAIALFEECLRIFPEDPISRVYVARCNARLADSMRSLVPPVP